MILVDSHCHLNRLDLSNFGGEISAILSHAQDLDVKYFLSVAVTLGDHNALCVLAERQQNVFISTGLHPNEMPGISLPLNELYDQAVHPKVVAIGETGLDCYRMHDNLTWQQERFIQHIECARYYQKPLIIHTREANTMTLKLLQAHQAHEVGGVMHCFTEDWEMARQALDLGFYISFSGIVTFKNAHIIQEVVKKVPNDRILVETDSPYLAPVPYRGKSNVPGYVRQVAEFVANLRNEPLEKIAQQTTDNFFRLFQCGV